MVTEYPFEIGAIKRDKVLGVSAVFSVEKAEGEKAEDPGGTPLAIYNKFSRIILAGIDKGSVSANINISSLEGIFKATDFAYEKHMNCLYGSERFDGASTPAYTVKIASGLLKGKTPAQILSEDPQKGVEALKKQYDWLKENLAKYPNNKEQMNAIAEAINLLKGGKLTAATRVSSPTIKIYDSGPRPNTWKKRDDGMCMTHMTQINFEPGEEYPVTIAISNFYAPFVKQENGRLNALISKRDEKSVQVFNLRASAEEWLDITRRIKAAMNQFEMYNAKKCIEDAKNADISNRKKAGIL